MKTQKKNLKGTLHLYKEKITVLNSLQLNKLIGGNVADGIYSKGVPPRTAYLA